MSKIAAVLLLTSTAAFAPATHATGPTVTFTSFGPARIGMSRQNLENALGTLLKSEAPDADSEGCEYAAASHGYKNIGFMLINQHLARIDVSDPTIETLSGAHIGSTQSSVMALYPGRIEVSPHAYTAPDGSYLTMLSPDRKYGIRFETDRGKVTRYYAGTADAIQYIEGCL